MFKKILAYALTVCLLISAMVVPAYAVDEVYSISEDTTPAPVIYYTEDYYPGLLAQLRNSMTFANNRVAHGSFATMNYNPSFLRVATAAVSSERGDFNSLVPSVIADSTDVSAVYTFADFYGDRVTVSLPSTDNCYFDFQSSNFLFDQQSVQANTFYVNGDLTFSLRNLWSFGSTAWYLASDPLAVQFVIDGKAYGDIIDVTGYTSPFTDLYNGGIPTNATVTFDNLKVYYQGDTPDMVGFRVYTGSAFLDGSYSYRKAGDIYASNTITLRVSEIPDITFVNEGGDGYAGDLSGISGLLSSIVSKLDSGFSSLNSVLTILSGFSYLGSDGSLVQSVSPVSLAHLLRQGLLGLRVHFLSLINSVDSGFSSLTTLFTVPSGFYYLSSDGSLVQSVSPVSLAHLLRQGFVGLRVHFLSLINSVDSGFSSLTPNLIISPGFYYLSSDGSLVQSVSPVPLSHLLRQGFLGLRSLMVGSQSYVADTVFPWQSYNMQTHQLNTPTNITGQNNLFFTAFQSMEDKLGRLAYVFGSDEDLALKDAADPSTDAFRQDFGGGASLSDIKDSAELATSVPQLMDSGFDFADGIEEIGSNNGYLAWFSAETWAALDSTGAAVAADSDYLSDYYDNLRKVDEKRHWGD